MNLNRLQQRWMDAWFPPCGKNDRGLAYWRARVLFGLLACGLAFSPVAIVPAVALILKNRMWVLAMVNTVALATSVWLLFSLRLRYCHRSLGAVFLFYVISLGVLTNAGIISGGPIWLFSASIIAGLLLGFRSAGLTILINTGVLAGIGYLISREMIGPGLPYFSSRESALASLGNFVLLNAGTTVAVSIIVNGLERVIRMQQVAADRLRREIDERKRVEEALRESELKYRRIFDNIQDVYYEAGLDGRILEISPSIACISQYRREELIGKSLYEVYANPEQRDAFVRVIIERQRAEDYEIILKDKDGSQHTCSLVASIVLDPRGRPTKVVGSLRDISERKRAEAERSRLEAQDMQLQKAESLGRLAGAVAHLFNNQMAVVVGNLEMAIEDAVEIPLLRKNLSEAMGGACRAAEISRKMLTYLGRDADPIAPLDLSAFCRQCLPSFEAVLPDRVRVQMVLDEPGPVVIANAGQMQQVLMNLFANALEAIGDGSGQVSLVTRVLPATAIPMAHIAPTDWQPVAQSFACLEISDTGRGVAAENLDKLFDPFFTTKFVGRGMGLSVVLGIVRARGGMVGLESRIGSGATFRIVLPLAEDETRPPGGRK